MASYINQSLRMNKKPLVFTQYTQYKANVNETTAVERHTNNQF